MENEAEAIIASPWPFGAGGEGGRACCAASDIREGCSESCTGRGAPDAVQTEQALTNTTGTPSVFLVSLFA